RTACARPSFSGSSQRGSDRGESRGVRSNTLTLGLEQVASIIVSGRVAHAGLNFRDARRTTLAATSWDRRATLCWKRWIRLILVRIHTTTRFSRHSSVGKALHERRQIKASQKRRGVSAAPHP